MGLLDRLRGGKAELAVEVDPATVPAGATVTVTVDVTGGKKDMKLDEGYVELVYENRYTYRERGSDLFDSSKSTTSYTTTTDRVAYDRLRLLEAGRVAAGSSAEHTVELRVPDDAPPTAKGKITEVAWKVRAGLRRPGFDVDADAPVRVVSPREAYAAWADRAPEIDSHGRCELGFRLEERHYSPGQTIAGALVVRALQDCDVKELRVELVRLEDVPRDEGNEEQNVEDRAIVASDVGFTRGGEREFAFRLGVPGDAAPTLRTEQTTLHWLLRGIGSRRMRSDYEVTQELNVYSG